MKIEELRIGNWINTEHGFRKVATIEQNKIGTILKPCTMVLQHFDMSSIKPITLTADLLLKCGFDREERDLFIQFANNFNLTWNEIDDVGCCLEWKEYNLFQWGKCEYLHQLQNLYFALTGEELTIETF